MARIDSSPPEQTEQHFHDLLDAVLDYAIFRLDAEGRVATWNSGAQRLKGYTPEEIIGQHFSVFYTAEDRELGRPREILEIVRDRGRFEDEAWRVRKDGSRFWANVVITSLRDESGALVGFAKVTRDLTERREAEENARRLLREQTARLVAEEAERKLRESEQRYRALSNRLEIVLEGVADGITVQEQSGRLVFANSAAARLCGFESVESFLAATPEEITARFEMLDEEGRPFPSEDLPGRRVLSGEPRASAVIQVRERATGKHWWSLVRAGGVLDPSGQTELVVNIWHDITVEHRAERDARYAAQAILALGSSTNDAELLTAFARVLVPTLADHASIDLLDGDTLRNVASVHAEPTTPAPAGEARAHPFPESSVRKVVRSGAPELHNGITEATLVVPILTQSKVIGAISLVSAESHRRYDESQLELVKELSERASSALERASLYRTARAAAKAAEDASRAKDEFLATVSHELRTPLNAMLGWSSILKDRVTDPAIAKPIQAIFRNAQAQVKIIEDLLDVSRVITGKFRVDPAPVDLVKIAKEAAEVVRPSATAKSVAIDFDFEHEFFALVADAERLQQVVWNLLSNAVKFTPAGGTIMVSVRREQSRVLLQVSDTGAGIDPSFLPFVFDRFRQADPSPTRRVGGLGLGLALVRHIVELHGGHVEAASDGLGKGATFTIALPVHAVIMPPPEPATAPEESADTQAAPATLAGRFVLVVDDEQDARDIISTVLEGAGARVATARSAAEALLVLQQSKPDALVSDIAMPAEDGYTLIQKVRARPDSAHIPALALTAYARDEDRLAVLEAGFDGHLGKPTDPAALVAKVAEVTRRPRPH